MDISLMCHINPFGSYRDTLVNDMYDDGPARDFNTITISKVPDIQKYINGNKLRKLQNFSFPVSYH